MFTDMVYVTLFLKGLTPLYHACLSGKNPNVAELLLGDQADIGVVDSQGWQEIHQVQYASLPDNSYTVDVPAVDQPLNNKTYLSVLTFSS